MDGGYSIMRPINEGSLKNYQVVQSNRNLLAS